MDNVIYKFKKIAVAACLILLGINNSIVAKISASQGDFQYEFSGMFRPEMFAADRLSLLNRNNRADKLWLMRHILDLNLDAIFGLQTSVPAAEFYLTLRNKGVWGNPSSIAQTTSREIRSVDVVEGAHTHAIPRHFFWGREWWLNGNWSQLLGLNIDDSHQFRLGAFPFQLGRGIALGDSFAVGQELLGFYFPEAVDQYAFGGLLYGDIIKNTLRYNLYSSILDNKSSSLADTAARIYGQEYGRLETPARGFGKISFIVASKLNWNVFDNAKFGKLSLEPYALFNHTPEQKIEFLGDASSKLGTFGFAGEYVGNRWELGFDYAFNIGRQYVKGWDRNILEKENRGGYVIVVNSHVDDGNSVNPQKIPHVPGSEADKSIRASRKAQQSEDLNGKDIKKLTQGIEGLTSSPLTLHNKNNRFRDPYTNVYEGWMFVVDGSCWIYKRDLKVAATAAIATGDDNPNEETEDAVYSGFIPLQETYSGERVQSAFLLGGAGKLVRPLSVPTSRQSPNAYPASVQNFTNLVFFGTGLQWTPTNWKRKLEVKPNVLFYWQDFRINKFDALTKSETAEKASTYLGSEYNIFVNFYPLKDLKVYCVTSVFAPGSHFTDIKGKPLTSEQARELDQLDRTAFDEGRIPNLGNNIAFTFNLGLSFNF